MFNSFKEKSWSVLLIKGYVSNDKVRAEHCENCKSTTEVLTTNYNNPNLLLNGCKDNKCKHRLLRLDFDAEVSKKLLLQGIVQTDAPEAEQNLRAIKKELSEDGNRYRNFTEIYQRRAKWKICLPLRTSHFS